jgi:NADH dehydrogenase
VTVDLPALCQSYENVTFVKAQVHGVDFERKRVRTDTEEYAYDYIVLAMGSRTYFPESVPGLHDYAHGVKSLERAFEFRQQFEQELYARMDCEMDEPCRRFCVVVAGAGLSGVEIAAEMADYSRRFLRRNRMMCEGIDIRLIASHGEVLAGMHPYLKRSAARRLEALGVTVMYDNRVSAVEPNRTVLSSGETVDFDFMIFAGGIVASTLTRQLDLRRNKKGQIAVGPSLVIEGQEAAFAVGDVADLKGPDGAPVPPTANGAEQSANLAALNILRAVRGKPMAERPVRLQGFMVTLGRYSAAVVLFDRIKFSGLFGFVVKRLITDRYKFLLDSRAYKAFRRLRA